MLQSFPTQVSEILRLSCQTYQHNYQEIVSEPICELESKSFITTRIYAAHAVPCDCSVSQAGTKVPNKKCCMIGNLDSTSTWYILIIPELTCKAEQHCQHSLLFPMSTNVCTTHNQADQWLQSTYRVVFCAFSNVMDTSTEGAVLVLIRIRTRQCPAMKCE